MGTLLSPISGGHMENIAAPEVPAGMVFNKDIQSYFNKHSPGTYSFVCIFCPETLYETARKYISTTGGLMAMMERKFFLIGLAGISAKEASKKVNFPLTQYDRIRMGMCVLEINQPTAFAKLMDTAGPLAIENLRSANRKAVFD